MATAGAGVGKADEDVHIAISFTEVRDEFTCPVCFDLITAAMITPCGHLFCDACVRTWVQHNPVCPTCRMHCTSRGLVPNRNADQVVSILRRAHADFHGTVKEESNEFPALHPHALLKDAGNVVLVELGCLVDKIPQNGKSSSSSASSASQNGNHSSSSSASSSSGSGSAEKEEGKKEAPEGGEGLAERETVRTRSGALAIKQGAADFIRRLSLHCGPENVHLVITADALEGNEILRWLHKTRFLRHAAMRPSNVFVIRNLDELWDLAPELSATMVLTNWMVAANDLMDHATETMSSAIVLFPERTPPEAKKVMFGEPTLMHTYNDKPVYYVYSFKDAELIAFGRPPPRAKERERCKMFLKGRCRRGRACKYAHTRDPEPAPKPAPAPAAKKEEPRELQALRPVPEWCTCGECQEEEERTDILTEILRRYVDFYGEDDSDDEDDDEDDYYYDDEHDYDDEDEDGYYRIGPVSYGPPFTVDFTAMTQAAFGGGAQGAGQARGGAQRSDRLCRFAMRGHCRYGERCKFRHPGGGADAPREEVVSSGQPSSSSSSSSAPQSSASQPAAAGRLGLLIQEGSTTLSATAPFAPQPQSSSASQPPRLQGQGVCHAYQRGHCRFGNRCRYRHVQS